MSAANPYWLIWWLTIGRGYDMFSMKYGWLGVALFFIGHILATSPGTPWYPGPWPRDAALSLTVSTRAFWPMRRLSPGFGGYFAVQGVKFLLNSLN